MLQLSMCGSQKCHFGCHKWCSGGGGLQVGHNTVSHSGYRHSTMQPTHLEMLLFEMLPYLTKVSRYK